MENRVGIMPFLKCKDLRTVRLTGKTEDDFILPHVFWGFLTPN